MASGLFETPTPIPVKNSSSIRIKKKKGKLFKLMNIEGTESTIKRSIIK